VRRGLDAFACGDYSLAIQAWKQAHRAADPGDAARTARSLAEAHFRRALGASNAGRQAQDLGEAVQLAPDRAIYHFHLGLACLRQGQHRRAAAALEAAHHLEPADARTQYHFVLAALADELRSITDACTLLHQAPARTEAMSRLDALTALRQHEPARAAATLWALSKRSPLANLAFGIAQLGGGHPLEALESLVPLVRRRAALTTAAREAATIATAAARLATGDSPAAMHELRRLEPPTEPVLRTAFASIARRVAQELVLDERLEDGLLACQLALAVEPDHMPSTQLTTHLHEVLGARAAQRSDFDRAAQHWAAALDATSEASGRARILRNLALAEEQLERWAQASDHWETLAHQWKKEMRTAGGDSHVSVELRQRLAVVYRHLAATYEAADDVHNAARSLESALHFDPSQLDLPLRAAELYLENEDYGRAIDHLRRALTAHPDDTRIMANLGAAYDLKGDDRQAQRYLEEALALEPANQAVRSTLAGVHHARGHRMLDGGQGERAAAEFQHAVELDPSAAEHYTCLGEAFLAQGDLEAAAKVFKVALALDGGSVQARVQVGKAYLAHGFEQEATKWFRQALRASRAAQVRVAIGLVYMQLGRRKQSFEHFEQVRKTRDAAANAAIARIFIDAEREAEAIPYLERAVALDPLDTAALLDLAYAVAFGRRDYDRAAGELAAAERAATLSGDDEAMPEIETARQLLDRIKLAAPARDVRALVERWP
jgi:tetratricopeptide (TPR) repeat protein